MKIKPISLTTRKFGSSRSSNKVSSFGAKRANDISNRLVKSKIERKQLIKKEFVSPNSLKRGYQQKGNRLDIKIKGLRNQNK